MLASVKIAREKFGEINVLVNCAGIGVAAKTLDNKGAAHPLDLFTKVINVRSCLAIDNEKIYLLIS